MRPFIVPAFLLVLLATPVLATGFVPGDKLYLTLRATGPVVLEFDGIPEMELSLKVKRSGDSAVITRIVLVAPSSARRDLGTASDKGKLKVTSVLDEAGTWSVEFHAAASAGDIKVKTGADVPSKFKETVVVPAEFEFHALANAILKIKMKGSVGPLLDGLSGPGGVLGLPVMTVRTKKLKTTLTASATGRHGLALSGRDGPGDVKVSVKANSPEGDSEIDLRVTFETGKVGGVYDGGVLSLTGAADAEYGVLYGAVDVDGGGGFTHSLENVTVVRDPQAPGGFRLERDIPGGAVPGTYTVDAGVASFDFDPGSVVPTTADMDVLLGGELLLPRPVPGQGVGTGFFARRADVTEADLEGEYLYLFIEQRLEGDEANKEIVVELEAGILSLDGSGGLLGGGLAMTLVLDHEAEGGFRTEGAETVLAFGGYDVDAGGNVTFSIRRSLFGASEDTEVRALYDGNLMFAAGTDGDDEIFADLLLRQGTDVDTSDAVGTYRHVGSRTAGDSSLQTITARSGSLTFDGNGGFSGTETVTVTTTQSGQEPQVDEQENVSVSGTYSITPFDLAAITAALLGGGELDIEGLLPVTLTFAGESAVGGIVGPNADYIMAFSLGDGLGFDLLIKE